ncbi:MAG TPA: sigma-54 dependent transcriptional regulator [Polyangiaceae bacterium]|nr:sigma-54 dependent transcriptional regulator [Polyangiaceae bacterium]
MNPRALIVDDEPAECQLVRDALTHAGFEAHSTETPARALELLATRPFDVVLTDLNMPGMTGTELCRRINETVPHVPVVVVTAFGSIDSAVDAMRAGAYDFLTKPFDVDAVALVLRRAVEHRALRREVDALRRVVDTSQRYGGLLGTSQAMRDVYGIIERIAENDAPVLITGESGTGKEMVAREIHARGRQAKGRFVALNCAAMPETLLETELFGHVRGAFTDARNPREGLLVAASGGTLLLDEIGDMPLGLQPKLLRALQERVVRPVGATEEVPFDARLVAATNRDLESAIEAGRFREDLYYRINVIQLELPPLRARGGDALALAQNFLGEAAVRNGKPVPSLSPEAAERLLAYDWPGNVRELRNCMERVVALMRGERVGVEDLPPKVRDYRSGHVLIAGDHPHELQPLEEVERRYILRVVEACKGNKSQAARVLGIGRKTLYRRLVSFGVSVPDADA